MRGKRLFSRLPRVLPGITRSSVMRGFSKQQDTRGARGMLRVEWDDSYSPGVVMRGTQTYQYNRVRALHWCPRCFGVKDYGLLVCWPCNTRLKRAYDGGHGPMGRVYPSLDLYLANHRDSEARQWLKDIVDQPRLLIPA